MGLSTTAEALTTPEIPIHERVCARAFALTVENVRTESGVRELIELADGNPRPLGWARQQLARLSRDHPTSEPADRAVALTTLAWLQARAGR